MSEILGLAEATLAGIGWTTILNIGIRRIRLNKKPWQHTIVDQSEGGMVTIIKRSGHRTKYPFGLECICGWKDVFWHDTMKHARQEGAKHACDSLNVFFHPKWKTRGEADRDYQLELEHGRIDRELSMLKRREESHAAWIEKQAREVDCLVKRVQKNGKVSYRDLPRFDIID